MALYQLVENPIYITIQNIGLDAVLQNFLKITDSFKNNTLHKPSN